MAFSWIRRRRDDDRGKDESVNALASTLASIRLRIEDGLLMAFGPEGDPVPPSLLRTACTETAVDGPKMECGAIVDRRKVLAVIDAQQRAPLADRPSDGWIETMLGLGGRFQPTPPDLLADEPKDRLPPLPEAFHVDASTASIPLNFDDTERAVMADADALLLRGLDADMQLSAGYYDPTIDSWILRPDDIADLVIEGPNDVPRDIDLDVTAVDTSGQGQHWPVTKKRLLLSC